MRRIAFAVVVSLGGFAVTTPSHAVTCANGAAVVRKHPNSYYRGGYYHVA
jgi:hypothetical protein